MFDVTKGLLADSKKDTEAWLSGMLAGMARDDPLLALADGLTCLDVLRIDETLNPRRRYDAIGKVDLIARSHIRVLTRQYVEGYLRTVPTRETYIRDTVVAFLRHLADRYEKCVLSACSEVGSPGLSKAAPAMICRCIRSLGAQLKWTMFVYGASDSDLWQRLGALYLRAQHAGIERQECIIYPDPIFWTSVEQEYLSVLMWTTLGADSLTPAQIELVSRLNLYFAGSFEIQVQPEERCRYFVDLESATPPRRVLDREAGLLPSRRYFGPGTARERTKRLVEVLVGRHAIPAELDQGEKLDKFALVKVLHHAHRQWAPSPPARAEKRKEVHGRLFIVHGFDALAEACLSGEKVLAQPVESWLVKNMSGTGFGAEFPETEGDWPHVGCLLGVRLENAASWGVGIIRRLMVNASGRRYVGVQMLCKSASVIKLKPAKVAKGLRSEQEVALYLPGSDPRGLESDEVTLLIKSGSFASQYDAIMRAYDTDYPLMPDQVVEAGRDFQLVKYRLVHTIS